MLEKIYELLGVLGEVQPSDMINNSEKLFRAYLGELKKQVWSESFFRLLHCFICFLGFFLIFVCIALYVGILL